MTYAELAEVRGIDKQSAARLTFRKHWRRQRDNHGTVRVLVPPDWQDRSRDTSRDASDDASRDLSRDVSRVIAPLEAAITTLRDQLERANGRADRAEAATAAERGRADALRDRLTTMQEQLADAHAALQGAEVAETRIAAAEGRADRAEQAIAGERARADALRDRVEAREADLVLIRAALDQTQAEARKTHAEVETLREVGYRPARPRSVGADQGSVAGGVNMAEQESLPRKDWPSGVEPISWADSERLGVGRDGQLYWDGRPVVTRRRLDLSFWERFLGTAAAVAVIAAGIGTAVSAIDAGSISAARSIGGQSAASDLRAGSLVARLRAASEQLSTHISVWVTG